MKAVCRAFLKHRLFIFGLIFMFILVLIDQMTKSIAVNAITNLQEKTAFVHSHIRITSFFNIVLVWNRGISFGLFNNSWSNFILLPLIFAIVIFLLVLLFKTSQLYLLSAYSVILAGAIGNIIDRLRYGAVVDFLDFHIASYHWPAFNVADACICIGVILLLLEDILKKKTNHLH